MKQQPDFTQFLKVLTRQGRPTHLPGYEHVASPEFVERVAVCLGPYYRIVLQEKENRS